MVSAFQLLYANNLLYQLIVDLFSFLKLKLKNIVRLIIGMTVACSRLKIRINVDPVGRLLQWQQLSLIAVFKQANLLHSGIYVRAAILQQRCIILAIFKI